MPAGAGSQALQVRVPRLWFGGKEEGWGWGFGPCTSELRLSGGFDSGPGRGRRGSRRVTAARRGASPLCRPAARRRRSSSCTICRGRRRSICTTGERRAPPARLWCPPLIALAAAARWARRRSRCSARRPRWIRPARRYPTHPQTRPPARPPTPAVQELFGRDSYAGGMSRTASAALRIDPAASARILACSPSRAAALATGRRRRCGRADVAAAAARGRRGPGRALR